MLAVNGIKIKDVQLGFRGMVRASSGSGARDFFKSLVKPAREDLREHQKERQGETSSWPALDPDTLAKRSQARARATGKRRRRVRRSAKARMLGRLPRAWKVHVDADRLLLVNMVPWSGIHDLGGTAGNGARIPRRQFAYLSEDLLTGAQEIYERHVLRGWRNG